MVGCNKRDLDVSAFAFWNDYLVDIRGKLYFLHHFVISIHCQYSLNLKDYNDCLHISRTIHYFSIIMLLDEAKARSYTTPCIRKQSISQYSSLIYTTFLDLQRHVYYKK